MLLRQGILREVVDSGKLQGGRVLMADDDSDDDGDDNDDGDSDNDSSPDSTLVEQTGNLPATLLPSAIAKVHVL
jgi:hypothetical protein